MDKAIGGIIGAALLVAGIFFLIIFTTLMGALAGWVVGLFFSDTILGTLQRFGVDVVGLKMWQLGATLAFVGGFFKAYQTNTAGK